MKGKLPLGIGELTYLTIKSDATRVAALLSGEIDLVHDVPVQDIDRLEKAQGIRVTYGPENRTIFFGMDLGSPELKTSDVKGKNPFADVRVRRAMQMAIDREAIKRAVMRGQSIPAGIIAPTLRQRLHRRPSTRCRRSISTGRRSCSPTPATRRASRSRCIARTTATSTTSRSARR